MKSPKNWWRRIAVNVFTALVLIGVLYFIMEPMFPVYGKVGDAAHKTKQVNNAKQIALACYLFAIDHAGAFPNGRYDPDLDKITDSNPADTAEACFTDLIRSEKLGAEKIFWSQKNRIRCSRISPDEDGTLEPGENSWDYIAGLRNDSPAELPLVFEASDGGGGIRWTEAGGHPWKDIVVIGFVDGSAQKARLNRSRGLDDNPCLPVPGFNGWPETAKLVPATPHRKNPSP